MNTHGQKKQPHSAISVYQCVSAVQKWIAFRVHKSLHKAPENRLKVADFALLNHYILFENDARILNVLLEPTLDESNWGLHNELSFIIDQTSQLGVTRRSLRKDPRSPSA
jgi:hypothetical protein